MTSGESAGLKALAVIEFVAKAAVRQIPSDVGSYKPMTPSMS